MGSACSLDTIIVNWHSGDLLRECLHSLANTNLDGLRLQRVVVVDNGSTDGSPERAEAHGLPLCFVRNTENRGFAAACNQGASGSRADFLLFLNPDTRVSRDSLTAPIGYLSHPDHLAVGICGIQILDQGGHVARTCMRFPTPGRFLASMLGLSRLFPGRFPGYIMTDWAHDSPREVDTVIGAFFLVRRDLFESLGGFDERSFLYFEEVDFASRARQAGWQTGYVPEAHVYHRGSATWNRLDGHRLFHSARSRILYSRLHFPWLAAAVTVGVLLLEPLSRSALALCRGSFQDAWESVKAYARLSLEIPTLWKGHSPQ